MKLLITGGCGFIGSNSAKRFLAAGHCVVIIDNLSRQGSVENLRWLQKQRGSLTYINADIREFAAVRSVLTDHADVDVVLHLAAQVAVTTSVVNPRDDFDINLVGTFNLIEAVRLECADRISEILLIYASTNKVYGAMEDLAIVEQRNRYAFRDSPQGIPESRPLDFHSPYGCSKGGADQYVRDYSRIFGLNTVCFRQSCIYGYRQFGVEDQGWVAWFTIAAALGRRITIYGDGKQVRDVLFIEDLVDAYERAIDRRAIVNGKCYNVGGGIQNQLSLLELICHLEGLIGRPMLHQFAAWRPGDQPVFVSDISAMRSDLHWTPRVDVSTGILLLHNWVQENRELLLQMDAQVGGRVLS